MHTYMRILTITRTHTLFIHTKKKLMYIHTPFQQFVSGYIHTYIHTRMHTYIPNRIVYTYIHTYIHTHVFNSSSQDMYIHTYIHTHTHTHVFNSSSQDISQGHSMFRYVCMHARMYVCMYVQYG